MLVALEPRSFQDEVREHVIRRKAGDDYDEVVRNMQMVKPNYVKHEAAEAGRRSTTNGDGGCRARNPQTKERASHHTSPVVCHSWALTCHGAEHGMPGNPKIFRGEAWRQRWARRERPSVAGAARGPEGGKLHGWHCSSIKVASG